MKRWAESAPRGPELKEASAAAADPRDRGRGPYSTGAFVRVGADLSGHRSSKPSPGLGEPIELSGGSPEPPLTARIRRRHTTATLSAVRAHRGTEGSNPFPSREESSANFLEPTFDHKEFTADVTRFCGDLRST